MADSPACLVSRPAIAADTVTVMLAEPVDPAHAPVPTNDAEALVFRQFYETLVRLDCEGNVRPGLAMAWRQDGSQWTFTLRPNARFRDGSPLDATALLDGWRIGLPTPISGVRSEGDALTVFLSSPQPVTFFASPALRVTRRAEGSPWPVGTGPWEPLGGVSQAPFLATAPVGYHGAMLRLEVRPGADPRDLLDASAHLVIARDRAALDYAAGLPGWTRVPQGWDRVYLLLSPVSGTPDPAGSGPIREALAGDALRGDARPADPALGEWLRRCTVGSDGGPVGSPGRRRVVYPRGDAVARALAERLVARAETDLSNLLGTSVVTPGSTTTAAGLPPEPFARAVSERTDLAVVMPLRHQGAGDCGPLAALGEGWSLVEPLVETRAHALVRAGAARLVNDRDGIVIEPAGGGR